MSENTKKEFGLGTAIAMIVGIVVGSGIFFKADDILIDSGGNVALGVFILCIGAFGIIFGGLTLAQWAKVCSDAGGLISYMELAYGKFVAFLLGWFQMIVYFPALIAVIAYVASLYTIQLFPSLESSIWVIAIVYLFALLFMNIFAKKLSGIFQTSTTFIKLIPLFLIAIVGLIFGDTSHFLESSNDALNITTLSSAIVAVAFSYDGWSIAPAICHEIKDAKKNLPIALTIGPLLILLIYVLYFIGICFLIGPDMIIAKQDESIYYAAATLFGSVGSKIVLVFVIISIIGTLNGLLLGGTRVPYSLAIRKELPFSKQIGNIHKKHDMPILSSFIMISFVLLWLFIHYATLHFPTFAKLEIHIDELPIVINYIFYSLLYLKILQKGIKKEIPSFFAGILFPIFALLGAASILYGGLQSGNALTYSICSILVLISGILFYKLYKK